MDLYEVVAVLNARFTQVVACFGGDGDAALVTAFVEGGGEVGIDSVRQKLSEQGEFSTRVLVVATGSTTGRAPTLPSFSDSLFEGLLGNSDVGLGSLENLVLAYAKVSPLISMHRLLFGSALWVLTSSSFHQSSLRRVVGFLRWCVMLL